MSSVSPEDIELWKRDDYSEHWRTKGMEAEQCRYYFEFERVKIKAAINAAWDNLPEKADYKERYEELHKLENELDDGDTKWLAWIVANRKILD